LSINFSLSLSHAANAGPRVPSGGVNPFSEEVEPIVVLICGLLTEILKSQCPGTLYYICVGILLLTIEVSSNVSALVHFTMHINDKASFSKFV
jgi:hypothetical protein